MPTKTFLHLCIFTDHEIVSTVAEIFKIQFLNNLGRAVLTTVIENEPLLNELLGAKATVGGT